MKSSINRLTKAHTWALAIGLWPKRVLCDHPKVACRVIVDDVLLLNKLATVAT